MGSEGTSRGNLLVFLLADGSDEHLRRSVAERSDELRAVQVVAPARVGALEWLATDVAEARQQAHVHALAAEWMLADQAQVEGEAGDVDAVQAVEDALTEFPADEILIAGGPSEDGGLEASLRSFRLPVTRLGGSLPEPEHQQRRETTRAIIAGRSKATPFVFLAGVNLFLVALAALLATIALLVLWLL